jgi:hypothetical protein
MSDGVLEKPKEMEKAPIYSTFDNPVCFVFSQIFG